MDKTGLFLMKKFGLFLMELAPGSRGRKSGFENLAFCMHPPSPLRFRRDRQASLPFCLKGSPEPPIAPSRLQRKAAKPQSREKGQERQD
jgi:hypothetical protein